MNARQWFSQEPSSPTVTWDDIWLVPYRTDRYFHTAGRSREALVKDTLGAYEWKKRRMGWL